MNKRFNLPPPHKDPPASQEGLCGGASRPLPEGRGRSWVHPSGWGLHSPKSKAGRPGGARRLRESAESRSGHTAPREPRLWGAGLRERAGAPEAAERGGVEAGLRGRQASLFANRPATGVLGC